MPQRVAQGGRLAAPARNFGPPGKPRWRPALKDRKKTTSAASFKRLTFHAKHTSAMNIARDPLSSFTTVFPRQLPDAAARVLHVHQQLRKFERFTTQQQDKVLSGQLNHLLQHAKQYAPFWTERLAQWSARPQPLAGILAQVQPLTRKELQSEFDRLSAKFPKREALGVITGSTSGSTGTPVRFERCAKLYLSQYYAVALSCSRWHGMDQQKPLGVLGSRCKDKDKAPLGIPFRWLGPVAVGFERCTKEREVAETYEYCARRNPTYLQTGPTLLGALARFALDHQRIDLRPELALTLGSVVTDELRQMVRKGLGAKIVDRYSCEETGYIAMQCPKHDHMHVISPVTLMEIVDDDGAPCGPGKPGRVLITSMQSYAMPLIRYEIGDIAEWGEPCDCGITLPVIKRLWGRTRHLITTPDGRKTYARIYARDFDSIEGLLEYRFVLHQNAVVAAQLRAVEPSAAIAEAVTERVQRALSYPYPVRVRYVPKIEWGSWKQDSFGVSDAPAPA
jgi:phenylacetate-CoA ligase